jgi:multidrug resistance efflux pump
MTGKLLTMGLALTGALAGALGLSWPWGRHDDSLRLPGVVEVQEVRLGSKIGGRVAEVLTRDGDRVEAGQVMVQFEAPEWEAQRRQWRARLRAAEAALERARNGPREEDRDAARAAADAARAHWQLLKAGSRPEEIRQARAELQSAVAARRLALKELERIGVLRPQQAGTASEFDSRRTDLDLARARCENAQARLDLLIAGSRPEEIAEAAASIHKAEANARLLENGTRPEDVAEAEAQVDEARGKLAEAEANLREAVVRAPEPVVVEVLAVRRGDLVPAGQCCLRVLRADDLWVKVYVPETDLGKVRLGQEVGVRVDSHPGTQFRGEVMQIAGESEFTPRNVQSADERRHQVFAVKVRVADPQGVFKSGMAALVTVPLNGPKGESR